MIALDTNILVRFVTHDDSSQLKKVMRLLAHPNEVFFIGDIVFIELAWVLAYCYDWTRAEIADAFIKLLSKTNVAVEDEARLQNAVLAYQKGGDLADHLICEAARRNGCSRLATLDAQLQKAYPIFAFEPR